MVGLRVGSEEQRVGPGERGRDGHFGSSVSMSFGKAFVGIFSVSRRKFEAPKEKASEIPSVDYQIFDLILTGQLQSREDDESESES
jgi:hypothetical protein